MLIDDLQYQVALHTRQKEKNELGETIYAYKFLKNCYCQIVPLSGGEAQNDIMTETSYRYKFIMRKGSLPNGRVEEMKLIYLGESYSITHTIPNFKYKDRIEVFAKLNRE